MDDDQGQQLREVLEGLTGPVEKSATRLIAHEWPRLVWVVDAFLRDDPYGCENWKDAEQQWGRVKKKAAELEEALEGLGRLACAIRLDTALGDPGLWDQIEAFIPHHPGAGIQGIPQLKEFATLAQDGSRAMKKRCHGVRREAITGKRASLLSQLHRILPCPPTPWAHARTIAEAICNWSEKDSGQTVDWKRVESLVRAPIWGRHL